MKKERDYLEGGRVKKREKSNDGVEYEQSTMIYIYMYIYTCIYTYIYVYIYIHFIYIMKMS